MTFPSPSLLELYTSACMKHFTRSTSASVWNQLLFPTAACLETHTATSIRYCEHVSLPFANTGFSFSNETGGEWPLAGRHNQGTQRSFLSQRREFDCKTSFSSLQAVKVAGRRLKTKQTLSRPDDRIFHA